MDSETVVKINPVVNNCKLQQRHWQGIRASNDLRCTQGNKSKSLNRF